MLICICCVIFITRLTVSFCIKFLKKELKKIKHQISKKKEKKKKVFQSRACRKHIG